MIELIHITKRFDHTVAVDDVSLKIDGGEFCCLVGTSGCGKSTTLKMINRLIEHSEGEIHIDQKPIRSFREDVLRRRIGYAIQSTGLFPHWTVARNIGLVPRLLKWPKSRIDARVEELMSLLGLSMADYADKYPDQLSGGQAQRVGVARALAADPDILLMDEPFGALDPITRETLQLELRDLQARLGKTIVFVTHDMDEALRLADRLVVMHEGRIVQQGHPLQLLREPANDFVASLLGGEDRGLKEAALLPVSERMVPLGAGGVARERIDQTASLREALSVMLWRRVERLAVVDDDDIPIGELNFRRLVGAASMTDVLTRRWLMPFVWCALLLVGCLAMSLFEPVFRWLEPDSRDVVYARVDFLVLLGRHLLVVTIAAALATLLGVLGAIAVTRPAGREFLPLVAQVASLGQTFPPGSGAGAGGTGTWLWHLAHRGGAVALRSVAHRA